MSIRRVKRASSNGREREFWIVDVEYRHRDGRIERVRKVPRRQTRAAAEKMEREIIAALEEGGAYNAPPQELPPKPRFEDFANEFMMTYAKANNKASELHTKGVILKNHLLPFFGSIALDVVTVQHVERYKAQKRAVLSAKTINNHLAVLRKILRTAIEWGVADNLVPILPMKTCSPRMRFLSFDEAKALVSAADGLWWAMVTLALNTGMRQGELLALEWEHVDVQAKQITVQKNNWKGHIDSPKGGRCRFLPLNSHAIAALKRQRAGKHTLVFSKPDGSPLTYQQCRRPLLRAAKKAGLTGLIGWHTLRHTFGSHLVMKGVPLKAVQELLGHSTLAMTERYAHLMPDMKTSAVSVLEYSSGNLAATGSAVKRK